jgi:hypothetical protein
MTMQRRTLGRGRVIAALAGLALLVGCVLPWWRLGGTDGIPPVGGNGFEASGIVVFIVAIATLFLVALPYAAGDRPVAIDRWHAYALLAVAGWVGFSLRIVDLATSGALVFREPEQVVTNGPGLWVVAIGLIALSRAAFEIAHERHLR